MSGGDAVGRYPQPVLDYREPARYLRHGDDRRAWAWEFLRRNAAYQAFTDELQRAREAGERERIDELVDRYATNWIAFAALRFDEEEPDQHWRDDTVPHVFEGAKRTLPPWEMPSDSLALFDRYPFLEADMAWQGEPEERLVPIVFDAGVAWKTQVELAKKIFERRRRQVVGDRRVKFFTDDVGVRMLRVLDAVAEGLTTSEIVTGLGMDSAGDYKTVQEARIRAERLRDRDLHRLLEPPDWELG